LSAGEREELARLAEGVLELLADPGIVYGTFPGCRPWFGDAAYITAASPDRILALLAERDALAARLAKVEALADVWQHTPDHYCCEKCALRAALSSDPGPEGSAG
jgi:hypothetical protein